MQFCKLFDSQPQPKNISCHTRNSSSSFEEHLTSTYATNTVSIRTTFEWSSLKQPLSSAAPKLLGLRKRKGTRKIHYAYVVVRFYCWSEPRWFWNEKKRFASSKFRRPRFSNLRSCNMRPWNNDQSRRLRHCLCISVVVCYLVLVCVCRGCCARRSTSSLDAATAAAAVTAAVFTSAVTAAAVAYAAAAFA